MRAAAGRHSGDRVPLAAGRASAPASAADGTRVAPHRVMLGAALLGLAATWIASALRLLAARRAPAPLRATARARRAA